MASTRATVRKGGMCGKKYAGGRKHVTRRTKHKHTKMCRHVRRGAKKSEHKKRKHTRRERKMHGGVGEAVKATLAATGAPYGDGGSSNTSQNWITGTVSGQGSASNARHLLNQMNPMHW
jgi:hypothetical protein